MEDKATDVVPAPAVKDEPLIPVRTVEDIIAQIVPNAHCNRANCHGRGYIGIILNKDGSQTVLLCSCARYGQTEFVTAMRHHEVYIDRVAQAIDLQYRGLLVALSTSDNHRRVSDDLKFEHMKRIEEMTFTGRIKKLFSKKPESGIPVAIAEKQ